MVRAKLIGELMIVKRQFILGGSLIGGLKVDVRWLVISVYCKLMHY